MLPALPPQQMAFYGKTIMTDAFHIPTNLDCPISNPSNSEYILEEGQILLINFHLCLAHFLSLTHTCPFY